MPPKFRPFSRNSILSLFILVFFVVILSFVYFVVDENDSYSPKPMKIANGIQCYKPPIYVTDDRINLSSIRYLDDILDGEKQPIPGKTIFFHETTCSKTGIITLNAKQACAIESAARQNPNHDIFILFASHVGLKGDEQLPKYYEELQSFKNVHWRNVNLWRYSWGSQMFDWLSTSKLFDSLYLFEHMSDIIRALSLFRYGGYHVDLDVIVLKSFDDLGENFIADDWGHVVNGAVIHLNNHGIGRNVLHLFFKEVIDRFTGSSFIANGPEMLTHVLEHICKTKNRKLWTREQCQGIKVQPKEVFFPIPWTDFMMYFEPTKVNEVLERSKNSTLVHVWNDRSASIWNKVGTNNAYQVIAEQKCPIVYTASEYF